MKRILLKFKAVLFLFVFLYFSAAQAKTIQVKGIVKESNWNTIPRLIIQYLRTILRRERRVEFANEGLRYMDLIRWKLAEKVLTNPVIELPDPANQNRLKRPFSGMPVIDENGIPDYKPFLNQVKTIVLRTFDMSKQYLWPIPNVEIRVNPGLSQNPGY